MSSGANLTKIYIWVEQKKLHQTRINTEVIKKCVMVIIMMPMFFVTVIIEPDRWMAWGYVIMPFKCTSCTLVSQIAVTIIMCFCFVEWKPNYCYFEYLGLVKIVSWFIICCNYFFKFSSLFSLICPSPWLLNSLHSYWSKNKSEKYEKL